MTDWSMKQEQIIELKSHRHNLLLAKTEYNI